MMLGEAERREEGSVADVDRLIEQIIAATRAKAGRAFSTSKVYGSEPILMRGSQLASYLPEPIRRMRALARGPEARGWTDARLFVEQARLMEGYEDDCPYGGTFQSYFPTYDAMDNHQLRGYFTWRTNVRRGSVERTSTSFAYVYLYELLNGIGTEPGVPAFRAIESFWQSYREFGPAMDRYARTWLVDYAVYHGLDPALAQPYASTHHNRAVARLERAESLALSRPAQRGLRREPSAFGANPAAEEELLAALDALSTYRPLESRLYRDNPDALRSVTCAVFSRLAHYYQGSRRQGLVEGLFGRASSLPYLMFASAVFYPGARHPDCTYELDETCRFVCQSGIWTCTSLHHGGGRSSKLGQILRAVDRQLRAALDYPHPLKDRADPKYLVQLIDREVKDYLAWQEAHAPVRVEIDLSKLADIRSAAATTREALLVDEEREDAPVPAPEPTPAPAIEPAAPVAASATPVGPPAQAAEEKTPAPKEAEKNAPLGLAPDELALLEDLLSGRAPKAASPDLLVDSINEKLFDLVGDTVLEFSDAGAPQLIEDYVEDVRSALV